jgi:DNA invertase Pin-like site-specific DNA recombinase
MNASVDSFEEFAQYCRLRLVDDPHVWGTTLFEEVAGLRYAGSYSSFTRVAPVRCWNTLAHVGDWRRGGGVWPPIDASWEGISMGRTIAYLGTSQREQNPQLQYDALAAHGYDALFQEAPARRDDRPRFTAALAELKAGDTLLCWKVDHFSPRVTEVLAAITMLHARGVAVVSRTENVDPATREGRFTLAVLAAAAGYETDLTAQLRTGDVALAARSDAKAGFLDPHPLDTADGGPTPMSRPQVLQMIAKVNVMLRRLLASDDG